MGVELVRIAMQAYGARDYEIVLALADPMMRWDERAARPEGELVWGHDDVLRAMEGRLSDWKDYSFQLEELIDCGEHGVIAVYSERGSRLETDFLLKERHAALWMIENTRLVACAVYLTREEALRAAEMAARSTAVAERSPDPPAPSPDPAERPEPSAERPEPSAERPEPSAERPEPSAERPEPSAERPEPSAERPKPSTDAATTRKPLEPGSGQWARREREARRRAALRRAAQQSKAS